MYRFGNGLGIAIVIFVPLEEWLHVLRRNQAGVVTEHFKHAGYMMRARTRLHRNQAGLKIGKPARQLTTRELCLHRNRSRCIEAGKVERVLADVDTNGCDLRLSRLAGHGAYSLIACHRGMLNCGAGARPGHPITGHSRHSG